MTNTWVKSSRKLHMPWNCCLLCTLMTVPKSRICRSKFSLNPWPHRMLSHTHELVSPYNLWDRLMWWHWPRNCIAYWSQCLSIIWGSQHLLCHSGTTNGWRNWCILTKIDFVHQREIPRTGFWFVNTYEEKLLELHRTGGLLLTW